MVERLGALASRRPADDVFDDRDVVRHKLVQAIVKAYEAYSTPNGKHA